MVKYTPLVPGQFIRRCNAILANGCQCPRAGEFSVSEDGKEANEQICARCKNLQEANFAFAPKLYPTPAPVDEASSASTQLEEKEENVNGEPATDAGGNTASTGQSN